WHGHWLAVGSGDSFRLWDTRSSCSEMPSQPCAAGPPISARTGGVNSLAFDTSGRHLASGGYNGVLRLWTISGNGTVKPDGRSLHRISQGTAGYSGTGINKVAFSPTRPLVAAARSDGTTTVWNARHPRRPRPELLAPGHQ